jgi:hypothetical protein
MLLSKEFLCLLLGGWLVASTHLRIVRGGFGRRWRVWFVLLAIAGIALAFALMSIRYLESPTTRAYGVPFVIAGGDLVDGRWVDGGVGLYTPLPLFANVAFGVAVCMAPLAVLSCFKSRQVKLTGRLEGSR